MTGCWHAKCCVCILCLDAGTQELSAYYLAASADMITRTVPGHAVPAALDAIKAANSHEERMQALQHLQMLSCSPTVSLSISAHSVCLLTYTISLASAAMQHRHNLKPCTFMNLA